MKQPKIRVKTGKSRDDRTPAISLTKKDFTIQTFRGSGPGGQHRNTTDTAVRILHEASGARGEAQDSRSQHQNRQSALVRLAQDPKFTIWLNKQLFASGQADTTDYSMRPENLRIEVKRNGEWVVE